MEERREEADDEEEEMEPPRDEGEERRDSIDLTEEPSNNNVNSGEEERRDSIELPDDENFHNDDSQAERRDSIEVVEEEPKKQEGQVERRDEEVVSAPPAPQQVSATSSAPPAPTRDPTPKGQGLARMCHAMSPQQHTDLSAAEALLAIVGLRPFPHKPKPAEASKPVEAPKPQSTKPVFEDRHAFQPCPYTLQLLSDAMSPEQHKDLHHTESVLQAAGVAPPQEQLQKAWNEVGHPPKRGSLTMAKNEIAFPIAVPTYQKTGPTSNTALHLLHSAIGKQPNADAFKTTSMLFEAAELPPVSVIPATKPPTWEEPGTHYAKGDGLQALSAVLPHEDDGRHSNAHALLCVAGLRKRAQKPAPLEPIAEPAPTFKASASSPTSHVHRASAHKAVHKASAASPRATSQVAHTSSPRKASAKKVHKASASSPTSHVRHVAQPHKALAAYPDSLKLLDKVIAPGDDSTIKLMQAVGIRNTPKQTLTAPSEGEKPVQAIIEEPVQSVSSAAPAPSRPPAPTKVEPPQAEPEPPRKTDSVPPPPTETQPPTMEEAERKPDSRPTSRQRDEPPPITKADIAYAVGTSSDEEGLSPTDRKEALRRNFFRRRLRQDLYQPVSRTPERLLPPSFPQDFAGGPLFDLKTTKHQPVSPAMTNPVATGKPPSRGSVKPLPGKRNGSAGHRLTPLPHEVTKRADSIGSTEATTTMTADSEASSAAAKIVPPQKYQYSVVKRLKTDVGFFHLDCSNQGFTDLTIQPILLALNGNLSLHTLCFDGIPLTDDGCHLLWKALQSHPTLTSLSLVGCSITERGARGLINVLLRNSTLCNINLDGNPAIVDATRRTVEASLAQNRKRSPTPAAAPPQVAGLA
eukprot:TRINITY_DN59694_c0_g1_i1.p1 TRINITY_DN59694_c0_g1~~TRINITY_DN59694_c0_g1_i1.p1  ORF type:complete len:897 (-),score=100.98 TRINITY_DN59694_c0_g1_i1:584-3166(-)